MGKLDIAREYLHAPTYTLEAVPAFKALAKECVALVPHLEAIIPSPHRIFKLEIEPVAVSEPYPTAEAMFVDIEQGHLLVSNINSVHPQWTIAENIAFRTVHDVTGHFLARSGFSWKGELAAYKSQRRWHSELAVEALYTEIVGQTACYSVDRVFPTQKVILLGSRHDSIDIL